MTYLLSVDPGWSTGVVLGTYDDDSPFEVEKVWQIPGGVEALARWYYQTFWPVYGGLHFESVVEKFTPRPNGKFGLTLKSVEPLRCEGWLVGERVVEDYHTGSTEWQQPGEQYFAGGKTKVEKKKRQHQWLKEHDLYVTGKMVGAPDADDVRSTLAHALVKLRKQNHMPTLEHYFKES